MKITNLDQCEKTKPQMEGAKNIWRQVPLSSADGAPNYSFRVFTLEPGGHTPYHHHPFEHMNYIIEGEGAIRMENGEEREIKAGDFVLMYPDETHQYRNRSTDHNFIMICGVPKEYK
jgi:quercetin dioxygenase-like cupin family protein